MAVLKPANLALKFLLELTVFALATVALIVAGRLVAAIVFAVVAFDQWEA
jgi:hypothetical protein